MHVTALVNALKIGKTCKHYVVSMEDEANINDFPNQFFNWLDDWTLEEFIISLLTDVNKYRGIAVRSQEVKALQIFSPFVTVKPIKLPEKWTLPHVWKAILAGQVKKGICIGRYSDDYAGDAADNFGRDSIDTLELAQELIESPTGWWVRFEKQKNGNISLSVNCHHFNYNTLFL